MLCLLQVVVAGAGFVGEDAAADGVALGVVDDGAVGVELGAEAHEVFAGLDTERGAGGVAVEAAAVGAVDLLGLRFSGGYGLFAGHGLGESLC